MHGRQAASSVAGERARRLCIRRVQTSGGKTFGGCDALQCCSSGLAMYGKHYQSPFAWQATIHQIPPALLILLSLVLFVALCACCCTVVAVCGLVAC
jgi:hypothetical protein